jgi:DnaJ-class molecular chaperone
MNDMGMGNVDDLFSMLFGGGGAGGLGNRRGGGAGAMPEIRIFHGGSGGPFGPGSGPGPDLGNIYSHPFFRPSAPAIQKPGPIVMIMHITLEQAYRGCTLPVEVNRWIMIGDTKIEEEETLYVNIHSGVDDNEMIVLPEKGNAASDQHKGDVKLTIQVDNNTPFRRNGLDLMYRKTITLKEALCGFSFEFIHLNGKTLSLNNKANSTIVRPNYRKVVNELGMNRDGRSGSLIIEFDIEFPETLSREQIDGLNGLLPP